MYLEPVPLNSESEPPLTLISARVKSEEDSESSNSMRADSPTISLEELELIAMVGGVVSGGGAMEKERELLLSLPSLLKYWQHLRMNCWQHRWKKLPFMDDSGVFLCHREPP